MAAAPPTLSLRELNRATLARQLLLERAPLDVVEAVEQVGGLQAQEPKPPHLALWSRVEGYDPAGLNAAVAEREVVRATLMRSTLHHMSAGDYLAVRGAMGSMIDGALKTLGPRAEGLDLDRVLPAARELLAERPRRFAELRELLSERFPEMNDRALGYSVRLGLPLVMVPGEDPWGYPRRAEFALAEEWLGADPPEATPAALVRRHLGAFGPAAVTDVQAWAGIGSLRSVVEGMTDELEVFRDERGRTLYDLPGAPRPGADAEAPARLLPEFDSLVLAYDDRTRVVAEEHRKRLVTKNLRVRATFLWDGFVAGTWRVERAGRTATLTLEPFARLPRGAGRALTAEAEALLGIAEPDAKSRAVAID